MWWNFTWFGIFFRRHQTEEFPKRDSSHFCATFQIYIIRCSGCMLASKEQIKFTLHKVFSKRIGYLSGYFQWLHFKVTIALHMHAISSQTRKNKLLLSNIFCLASRSNWLAFYSGGTLICSINRAVILFHLLYTYPDLVCVEFNTRFKYRTQKTPYMTQY